MPVVTRSRADMKQDAIETKRHLVAMELEEEARLKAERTANLRKLRLEKEEAAREPGTDGDGEADDKSVSEEQDTAWPWRLPQAHRR